MTQPASDQPASDQPASDQPGDRSGRTDAAATEQIPVPPAARRSDPPPSSTRTAEQERPDPDRDEDRTQQDHAVTVLDEPIDNVDLATRLRRPGLARSTRILLLVLGAIVCVALGAFIGRATAPDTGPGSVPDLLGVVESVQPTGGGYPIVTIRAGDGTQTALRTTAGTSVAVPRPDGPAGLRVGQQVTVHAERGTDGAITAVRVDVPAGP
ncbi:hypothetical protein PHK61_09940 [Actinomycetospora lutea]|uniref:hypothetical protein n=1 Tax=Actinomycetospora lutea TaxID=663604 RepID=UPI0023659CFB|nr:hypothetical protein [Actinomycetospora lutea]MDD7938735.1 hypothetical protein [Actinomycetospora lutea]